MDFGLSTLLTLNELPNKTITLAKEKGFDYVEIVLEPYFPDEPSKDNLKEFKRTIESANLKCSVHGRAWDINPTSQYPELRELALKKGLEDIKTCKLMGGDLITIHPGWCWYKKDESFLKGCEEKFINYLQKLKDEAERQDVSVSVETCFLRLCFPKKIHEFKDILNRINKIGVTLDVGHIFISAFREQKKDPESEILRFIEELEKWISNIHLHDNRGFNDDHLLPGKGKINPEKVIEALKKHYDGLITLEIGENENPEKKAEQGIKWLKKKL